MSEGGLTYIFLLLCRHASQIMIFAFFPHLSEGKNTGIEVKNAGKHRTCQSGEDRVERVGKDCVEQA